jgi:hypothetical protein
MVSYGVVVSYETYSTAQTGQLEGRKVMVSRKPYLSLKKRRGKNTKQQEK